MNSIDHIIPVKEYFESYLPLADEDVEVLAQFMTSRQVKRRQFILQENDVCTHYTFIVKGCFKMYKVDAQGKEHNLQFAIENQWILDIGSFHSEQPSELYIEALEPSLIVQLQKPNLLHLYRNHPKFDRNFRVMIENQYIKLQQRVLQNISTTAEEKYTRFMEDYPKLFNRISNVQIASYLGVTPEFLSKIRKRIANS